MCVGKEGSSLKPQGAMRIKRGIFGSFMENKNKLIHNWNDSTSRRGMQSRHCSMLFLCELSIITESETEFDSLPRHSPCLPQRRASCEFQPRLVSWVLTAVTSKVPETEIYFFFWYELRLLGRRVAHFQSNNTCIMCHQQQVLFHRSNVNKCIHLSLEGKEAAHAGSREFASTVT